MVCIKPQSRRFDFFSRHTNLNEVMWNYIVDHSYSSAWRTIASMIAVKRGKTIFTIKRKILTLEVKFSYPHRYIKIMFFFTLPLIAKVNLLSNAQNLTNCEILTKIIAESYSSSKHLLVFAYSFL